MKRIRGLFALLVLVLLFVLPPFAQSQGAVLYVSTSTYQTQTVTLGEHRF